MHSYKPEEIELKWQKYWLDNKVFKTPTDKTKPKFYVLDMFPYPSGAGLHVGHPEGYTATDILARYKRMKGFNVLHPMGWDAFGLPAEQYAVKTGTHPRITTEKNIKRFREQLQAIGFSYDWDREVNTTDPNYYKWTQWIFLKLFELGLAYEDEVAVNWCPALGTVLANEEVIDGKSEVGGYPVIRKPMRQWVLKITAYADRLLSGLDGLDWPESLKDMQRNWIGKSIGAEVDFEIEGHSDKIKIFTTRPDTIFGATYMVLSPEHGLVDKITSAAQKKEVEDYKYAASLKSDLDRQELNKEKTGVFTGAYAVNPASGKKIPIWIADYVLVSYGTGAIMAVPAEDERDWDFAVKFNLPIIRTVLPDAGHDETKPYLGDGEVINSGFLNGLRMAAAKDKIITWLEKKGIGKKAVNYKLRDWLFSRQRYWGEPFPIIHVDGKAKAIPVEHLPLELPEVENYQPSGDGEPPLANAKEWVQTTDPETGKPALRETNTMPQWAGSCWYYLRYISPDFDGGPVNPDYEKYWMPVDLYVGGAEHAVLHLLYARFWHKVLFDCGIVSTEEPFQKLVNQGMILGEVEYTGFKKDGGWVSHSGDVSGAERVKLTEDRVEKKGEYFVLKGTDIKVEAKAHKMSKSRGNVINPDKVIQDYGADSLRLYEMFMGPLEQVKPWSTKGVEGVNRFLNRVWRLFINEKTGSLNDGVTDSEPDKKQLKALHEAIKKVSHDIEHMQFNTAISALMIFVNEAYQWDEVSKLIALDFLKLLSPFAPHISEELIHRFKISMSSAEKIEVLGELVSEYAGVKFPIKSIIDTSWPQYNEEYLKADSVLYPVQINGKVRANIEISADRADDKEFVLDAAKKDSKVAGYLEGNRVIKEIFVPGRIVNMVVKPE